MTTPTLPADGGLYIYSGNCNTVRIWADDALAALRGDKK